MVLSPYWKCTMFNSTNIKQKKNSLNVTHCTRIKQKKNVFQYYEVKHGKVCYVLRAVLFGILGADFHEITSSVQFFLRNLLCFI